MAPAPVVPPYVLEAIVRRGSARQRDAARRTLGDDATLRGLRRTTPRPRTTAAAPGDGLQRTIYDAAHGTDLTGLKELRGEGDPPTGDAAADEAYDGLGHTYTFWLDVFGRRSIDGAGLPLTGVVHYGEDYDNAFWDGRRMVFGDGDGELFVRFTRSLDVIGHELGHGVIEDEAGLEYQNQPGALNEHLADVFGILVKQYADGLTAAQSDWLIGAELRGPDFHGEALRSMLHPGTAYDDPVLGKDPQPADMAHYVDTSDDDGGVHINSGIPNRAFATLAVDLGGHAWERAGAIWYATLRDDRLASDATFAQFASLTHDLAGDDAAAVAAAWDAVGIAVT